MRTAVRSRNHRRRGIFERRGLKFAWVAAGMVAAGLLASCREEETPQASMPLVVEGWIEEGEMPVVIVSRAVDMTQDVGSFDGAVEKWCRVSVFDDGRRVLLTGQPDTRYMPPFIYTTSDLRGKEGHTYRLMVETERDTVYAESRLPASILIESLTAQKREDADSLYSIRARLRNVDPEGYYKFYTRIMDGEERYYPAFLGTFRGSDYDPEAGFVITRGIHAGYDNAEFNHYFKSGDRVMVKICTMSADLYEFWRVYDSNVSLSGNLFFTFAENCPHTVYGGFGYWGAFGMSRRSVRIPK